MFTVARKNYINSTFYKYLSYLYYFLGSNLLFLACNLIFIFVYFTFPPILENVLFYFVGLIPAGPALAALMFAMGQLVRTKSLRPWHDFWRGYKMNAISSLKFWLIQLVVMTILWVDVFYFLANNNRWLAVLFAVLLVLVIFFTMVGLSLQVTFYVTLKNLYKITVVLIFRHFKTQLFIIATTIAFLIILWAAPALASLFIFALISFYYMRSNNANFMQLKEEFSQDGVEE